MIFSNTQLGWSITAPFRKVGHVVKKGAQATGHDVKTSGKFVAHHAVDVALLATAPALLLTKLVGGPALKIALRPVRAKINILKDRRAKKLAWDSRKSKVPSAAEIAESKQWAKHELLHSKPPFGPVLSLLAGPPSMEHLDDTGEPTVVLLGEVVTAATVIASIPVLLAIVNALLGSKAKSGEAPASVGGDSTSIPGSGPLDPRALQTAAGQAAAAMQAQAGDGGGGDSGDESSSRGSNHGLPGGITKHHLIIGGVVVGGLVLVSMLLKKKS